MSKEHFDDDCPGCRPVILDVKTMKKFPADSMEQKTIDRVWSQTTPEVRQAFHRVTCQNSRDPKDIAIMEELSRQIGKAIEERN